MQAKTERRHAALYYCPDEPHPISEAIHLGRLASFYPKCRQCPHRDETGTLSSGIVKQLAETRRRAASDSLFGDEGVAGEYLNDLSPAQTRQIATAFGAYLAQQSAAPAAVVLAGDGRPLTPELTAAACEGLRWSGCPVIELGAATAPSLVFALDHLGADAGLLVGNARGEANTVGIKFWHKAGRPISAGSELQAIEALCRQEGERPARGYGELSWFQTEPLYLASLEGHYHALRPLRFVLDTACRPLASYFRRLAKSVACEMLLCREPASGLGAAARGLAEWVPAERAHFGLWIDGDGEACRFVDERGDHVTAEQMQLLLARHLLAQKGEVAVVVEDDTSAATVALLAAAGAKVVSIDSSRAAMDAAMREHQAILGGGASGRFWHGGRPPVADGLRTLSLVLTILSQSDRPFSSALAERGEMKEGKHP